MKDPTPKKHHDEFIPFIYPIQSKQTLDRPIERLDKEFLDVVLARRSTNNFLPITTLEISNVLYWSTRIHSYLIDESGYVLTHRTTPSGGARHPVDLLISIPNLLELRQISYYNPIDHSLGKLLLPNEHLINFFKKINKNLSIKNACIIWFSVQTSKTASKYENPESLYWKDAGALLYCIQLIATYYGYKSCPIGTLANTSFNKLFNSRYLISGGGLLLGK